MHSTSTEVHRHTKKVFRPVQNGSPVQITEHGRTIARIEPVYPVVTMSAEEFRAPTLSNEELNTAINEALEDIRA